MYFTYNNNQNLLIVDDDYANLLNVNDDDSVKFQFTYKVSSHEAIKNNATKVNVSVFSRTVKQTPLINVVDGTINSKSLVKNILSNVPQAKLTVKLREEFNSVTKSSDITTKINNEIVSQLRSPSLNISNIPQLSKTVLKSVPSSVVKSVNESRPIMQFMTNISALTSSVNPTQSMKDLILRQGIDPSKIIELTPKNITSVDSFNGTFRPTKSLKLESKATNGLVNLHTIKNLDVQTHPNTTSDVQDETYVQIISKDSTFDVEVPVNVVIPKNAFTLEGKYNTQFHVKFELIDSKSGLSIDTVVKQLDVSQHLQMFNTPTIPPIVSVIKSSSRNKATLSIKQIDKNASSVQIFKKNIYRSSVEIDDYVLFGVFDVRSDQQTLLVQIVLPTDSTAIYRVVPLGPTGIQGSSFTNVVVNPLRFKQAKQITCSTKLIDVGIQFEFKNIPSSVVALELLALNASIYEKQFRNVGGITFINDNLRQSDTVVIVDKNVFQNNVYNYSIKLIYASGISDIVSCSIVEYIKQTPNKVDTKIKNLKIDNSEFPNVEFDIDTTIIDSNIDSIKLMLNQQDMSDFFSKDISLEREFLKSLIAHNVQRVNLTTGVRENFGVLTVTKFSDSELRTNQSVEPLKIGNRYRYEITVLLRSPETMFETFIKSKVDLSTKKSYSFKPSKFFHPLALNLGILTSAQGLKTNYSKDEMSHGTLGSSEVFEVSFDSEQSLIKEATVTNLGKYVHVLLWKLQGNIDNIDHFLITKDSNGVRTLIDVAHSEFVNGNCLKYIKLNKRDNGTFKYIITPIYNDYNVGIPVSTNQITVQLST
jgi:hypothetical protein